MLLLSFARIFIDRITSNPVCFPSNDQEQERSKLVALLKALLNPRGNFQVDNDLLMPIFALMCFTEGTTLCKTVKPFLNDKGTPVAFSSEHATSSLSTEAMEALNGRKFSSIIYPPEEAFICLILAKYVMHLLHNSHRRSCPPDPNNFASDEDDDFASMLEKEGITTYGIIKYKKETNESYDKNDFRYFFKQVEKIHKICQLEARQDSNKEIDDDAPQQQDGPWYRFDYQNELDASRQRDSSEDSSSITLTLVVDGSRGQTSDAASTNTSNVEGGVWFGGMCGHGGW